MIDCKFRQTHSTFDIYYFSYPYSGSAYKPCLHIDFVLVIICLLSATAGPVSAVAGPVSAIIVPSQQRCPRIIN